RGNTRDIFEIELDDSDLPSGWEANVLSQSTLDLPEGLFGYVQVRVEAPVSASGGSDERVTVIVTSSGDSNVNEEVRLETTVRIYGVAFVSPPDEIRIDPENLDIDGYYRFSVNIRNTGSDKDTYKLDATTARSDWTVRVEIGGNEIAALTVDKSGTEKVEIVLRPLNYEGSLGDPVGFLLTADSISPGDGSASLSFDLFMEIPLDRITDLSVSVDDVLINGKPQTILTAEDLNSAEPIQLQINIHNNGGKATGPFGVKLYLGQLVIDEYRVSQGISGFGVEPVILNWENPSPGSSTLKIFVDFEQEVDELNSNRADNSLSLPIFVSEKTTTSSDNDEDDPLLIGPSSIITFSVLMTLSIIYRRKH
ncbi:MAG TPA: CARDB domain-containing protein, partial [Candidatus Poseidoniia archaeon]|nr:CARDB domain-containing protein [Candidatus Poseidoniia archaeon]